MEEKRKEKREDLVGGTISFAFTMDDSLDNEGVTINISSSGVAFYTHREVAKGMGLRIKGAGMWNGVRYATVRWCEKVENGIYKIGLSFD